VTATGQLSCSCPSQKSKNFVFRARTTSLRFVVPPAPGGPKSLLGLSSPAAPVALGGGAVPGLLACATATAATLPTQHNTRNRTGGRPRQRPQRFSGEPAFLFGKALLKPVWLGSLPLCVLAALYLVQCRTHYAAEFDDTLACLGGNGGGVLFE
jgi:hypothetical protein